MTITPLSLLALVAKSRRVKGILLPKYSGYNSIHLSNNLFKFRSYGQSYTTKLED